MALPGLRDVYNAIEQTASPLLSSVIRTEEFARVAAAVTVVNKKVRTEVEQLQARCWHAVNLPAGTDVQRLRRQLGALDREVRLLTIELEKERAKAKGVSRRGVPTGSEHDRPDQA
ncbi:hypothetical protein FHP29_11985 [Nocardioides albidus]|uniref:Uncharacterized protein n=1 Tax=Nocardioides albidus TaxID=1517589 RepID=A0A5C4VUJ6_9ACTN|nr:hypothetical protein [Nocardioides albidus]TNM39592.1 hypothetical protein FHP29_11985 [Nocardioides albidus]